ncbi:hypothetical protein HNP52_001040 [Sphingomonas kyeonggiensis]|uniref:Uncharacterized protein n=1 Tax=Sphingomonas kyeonggiensis TaxID=1268553 RepID=A0A7W7JZ25_9SPHN|nr:hypothetical protein [Sphingomonas kyeonggiensis]MBB4837989.1 hypothetical protein [Sphingomonas kyeonggiensis]
MPVLPFALLLLLQDAPAPIDAELVEVAPGPKRYFHAGDEREGCPAPTAACRRKGYVVAGDRLVAWEAKGALTRVTYLAPGSTLPSEGWIESAALRRVAPTPPKASDWLGGWNVWEAEIDITRGARPGSLHFSGNATWGARDPERVKIGAINTGGFGADRPVPAGDRIEVSDAEEPDCRVAMRLLGPYLIARDNGQCGGLNVTFTGVYRR